MNVAPQSFNVITANDGVEEWKSSDEFKYSWGCGPAGDLMIFRSKFHAAFSAKLESDVRWYLYAPGTWKAVEVVEEDEDTSKPLLLQS